MPPGTDFTFDLNLGTRCVRCGDHRDVDFEAEARTIAKGERTFVIELAEPCECGERRVKVTVNLQAR